MVSFVPFINICLAVLGISLVGVLISGKARNVLFLKLLFAGYFLVVIQYNFERITSFRNYLILAAAALALVAWYFNTRHTEEQTS